MGSWGPRFLIQTPPVFKMSEDKRVRSGMERQKFVWGPGSNGGKCL